MKAAALLGIILAGCATVPPPAAGPTAAVGQGADIGDRRIRPLAVVQDSRCAALVRCVSAGGRVVRARMNGQSWTQIRDFELGVPQAVDRYRVALIAAEPQKAVPGEIDPRAYRFTFAV